MSMEDSIIQQAEELLGTATDDLDDSADPVRDTI